MVRIKNQNALRLARLQATECAICGATRPLSIHHVYPRSQGGDDVRANLEGLCGDGVRGCHGDVECHRGEARRLLGLHILGARQDTVDYIGSKLGGNERALAWIERNLLT